ncbi:tape measure protein [Sphingomonas parapaucimobilis]|uniref:tape measure protein n=1 Tax=Sphingomonas parapaucimobilis TaxID=28213 RepID=UPI00391AA042
MAGPSATLETRFTATITQFESELRRLQRLNAAAANNVANAHRRAAQQSNAAWGNSNIGRALERQLAGAGSAIKQYAGLLAGMFAGREALQAADAYTRFSNSLKVAGLEGTALKSVQEELYAMAIKNGIALEPLGKLYGRASQSAKELGASQKDLLAFTNGVSSALRVSGTSTEEASGALLQLSQLLASGTVHAEEFNSVNEGARPILEAVARGSDKYGGSVAKLRAEVLKQKVTSREFFAAFLAGSASLEAQAAKAPLTVAASFQNLQTALTHYIGQADQTWNITAKLTAAIKVMAENFGPLVQSVAILGAMYAATFVPALGRAAAGLAVSTVATIQSTVASIADTAALFARASAMRGLTTAQTAAILSTRALNAALSFLGGPVGIAIMAIGAAIAYLGVSSAKAALETSALNDRIDANAKALDEADRAAQKKRVETGNLTSAEHKAAVATAAMTGEVAKLKDQYYLAAAAAKALAIQQARTDMIGAKNDMNAAREGYRSRVDSELRREQSRNTTFVGPGVPSIQTPLTKAQRDAAYRRANASEEGQTFGKSIRVLRARVDNTQGIMKNGLDEYKPAPAAPAEKKDKKKGKKEHDPADASIAAVEQAEKAYRQAMMASAQTAEERHKFALENLKADHDEAISDLDRRAAKGDITKAAAETAKKLTEQTYEQNIANEMLEFGNTIADRQNDITQQITSAKSDELRLDADRLAMMADSEKNIRKRFALERQALTKKQEADDAEFRVQQDILALQRLREGYTRAEVEQLRQAAENNRNKMKRNETAQLERDQKRESPKSVAGQISDYAKSFGSLNERLGNIAKNGIDNITAGLTDAITGAKSFQEAFGEMAKAVIAQLIQMAVRFAIFEMIGAAFGVKGLGKASLGIETKKNAMGTNFFPGGLSLVGEKGPELVGMPRGSQVLPNNLLKNAFAAPVGGNQASQVTNINTTVNANDAVLTDTVKGWIRDANVSAVTASQKMTTQRIAERNRNTLGRR